MVITVSDGFWVVSIDRASGATTTEMVIDRDDAYQRAIDIQTSTVATHVVRRLSPRERNR